jgi:hypothetical protein
VQIDSFGAPLTVYQADRAEYETKAHPLRQDRVEEEQSPQMLL